VALRLTAFNETELPFVSPGVGSDDGRLRVPDDCAVIDTLQAR
jgi:hypothetical protein